MDISPVDYVAKTMAELINWRNKDPQAERKADFGAKRKPALPLHLQPKTTKTFHIANNTSLSLQRLALLIAEARAGKHCNSKNGQEKATGVPRADLDFKAIAAAKLAICRLYSPEEFQMLRTMDLFQATGVEFDMHNTRQALPHLSIPKISDRLLKKYIAAALGG
ncbi:MAG: hypothetical protein BWY75_03448 [bacterium ADurb.Bin425]|nr:MAG: hypothetical protein BWY75_03448 [bacterium ADurb.Bin425]